MASNPVSVILLTRAWPQAVRYRDELGRDLPGAQVEISPLVRIERTDQAQIPPEASCVVFTSVNAVSATPPAGLTAYCVGARTAQAARDAGFRAISADGDAVDLAARILADQVVGAVYYPRGEQAAVDLASLLGKNGLHVLDQVVYRQVAVPLTAAAAALFRAGKPLVVPVFSVNAAARLLAETAGLPRGCADLCAISPNVAAALTGKGFRAVRIATRPTAEAVTREIAALL